MQDAPEGEGEPLIARSLSGKTKKRKVKSKNKLVGSKFYLALFAGAAGCFLEWYAFGLYTVFADELGCAFFPPGTGPNATQLVYFESFVIFSSAFLTRPLGGAIMGWIGDRYGRILALQLSVAMLALPSACVGILPGFDSWGWASPTILLIIRLLQGIFVGGEVSGSIVYVLEAAPAAHQALAGCLLMLASSGQLLASVISATLRATLSAEEMHQWGWRAPWLLCIFLAIVGCGLRCCLDESEEWKEAKEEEAAREEKATKEERRAACRQHALSGLTIVFGLTLWHSGFYLLFTWLPSFMLSMRGDAALHAVPTNATLLFGISDAVNRARLCGASGNDDFQAALLANTTRLNDAIASSNGGVYNQHNAWLVTTGAFVVYGIALILSGWLTDRLKACIAARVKTGSCPHILNGSWIIPSIAGLVLALITPVCFHLLGSAKGENISVLSFGLQSILALVYGFATAPISGWLMDVLPDPKSRYLVLGISYNFGALAFSGTTPLIATAMITNAEPSVVWVGLYFSALCVIAVIAMLAWVVSSTAAAAAASTPEPTSATKEG